MLSKMSLAKKITSGFLIILTLLVAIAFVGRFSLSKVVTKVDSANQFQFLVNHVLNARQNEKKFILSNDNKAVDEVNLELVQLKTKAQEVLSNAKSDSIKKSTNEILSNLDKYNKAFSSYVKLANKKDALMKDMAGKADLALKTTASIRDEQLVKFNKLKEESVPKIEEMRLRVKYSIDIQKSNIHAKGYRMALTAMNVKKNTSFLTEWEGKHKDLKIAAAKVKPLLHEDISKKGLNSLLQAHDVCIAKARSFFNKKSDGNRFELIKAAKELEKHVIIFNQEMQEQLEFYVEDVQIFSGEMIELSSSADQIAKILLKTRILEKDFIRTENDKIFTRIIENIQSIDKVIADVKENIDDEEKTKSLAGIQSSVNNYLSSFKNYAGLMKKQQISKTIMESNAGKIQAVCLKLKDHEYTQMESQIGQSQGLIAFVSFCALIGGCIIAFFLIRIIIKPLKKVVVALKDISEGDGDLTQRIDIKTEDEIGHFAQSFNAFISKLNNIIVDISVNSETVSAASGEVLSVSEQMAESADDLFSRSNSVAAAAEEMSSNMDSVAAASEQAATNLDMVSGSAVQMKTTLSSIAANCEKAREVSDNAAKQVENATGRVGLLGNSALEISKVTDVITDIASQINLLALNATIEAARAGEAGRGFAVVADEIKGLANQTADAILDIKQKIESIQSSTDDTVKDVEQITGVISEVSETVSVIASAIEEQSSSAVEIAQNMEQASIGIGEVNENVSQSSQVASDIAEEIAMVNSVAEIMNTKSNQTNRSAGDLSSLSSSLRDMISVFKVSHDNVGDDVHLTTDLNQADIVDLMPWTPKLEISIKSIDEQHKKLVEMINHLHRAMKMKLGSKEAGQILNDLAEYTVYHFGYEEKLFEKHEYPEYEEHKKIHVNLVAKVMEFQEEFKSGKAALSIDLMDFLTDWLKNHIMVTDVQYVPFFKDKGVD
jgi:hemerythrin-like metal-binding protein